jgi:hypothetical protein
MSDPTRIRVTSPDRETHKAVQRVLAVGNASVMSSSSTTLTHIVGYMTPKLTARVEEAGGVLELIPAP